MRGDLKTVVEDAAACFLGDIDGGLYIGVRVAVMIDFIPEEPPIWIVSLTSGAM